ncbi:MAG: hypothetical protein ACOZBW_01520, partial [Thermodesulfobacteriota bacterium]
MKTLLSKNGFNHGGTSFDLFIQIEIADMVEPLSTEKPLQTKEIGLRFPSNVCIEAGSAITTVEHS